jgi:hypothetical protein
MNQEIENINKQLEEIIKKNLPMKYDIGEENYDLKDRHLEYNEAIDDIDTSLIADEVLKVVVEKIKEKRDYWKNKPWNPEWNLEIKDKVEVLEDLLSNLSPNKENEK